MRNHGYNGDQGVFTEPIKDIKWPGQWSLPTVLR